jgi:hypothetical protein
MVSRTHTPRTGVTLFLYSISQNPAARAAPPPRPGGGRPDLPLLQLDLRFLLTAWAKDASAQHEILGWMMRYMEDHPILPALALNQVTPAVFQPQETIEVVLDELSSLDLIRIWEKSLRSPYQLSVAYLARSVAISALQSTQNQH